MWYCSRRTKRDNCMHMLKNWNDFATWHQINSGELKFGWIIRNTESGEMAEQLREYRVSALVKDPSSGSSTLWSGSQCLWPQLQRSSSLFWLPWALQSGSQAHTQTTFFFFKNTNKVLVLFQYFLCCILQTHLKKKIYTRATSGSGLLLAYHLLTRSNSGQCWPLDWCAKAVWCIGNDVSVIAK